MHTSAFLISLCSIGGLSCAFAQDAPKQLTARELFYSAAQAPKAESPKAAVSEPGAVKPPEKAAAKTPEKSVTRAAKRAPAEEPLVPVAPPRVTPVRPPEDGRLPGGGQIIIATDHRSTAPMPTAGPPLGLRYTILKKTGNRSVEVPVDSVFHTGDRIQCYVQTNGPGYLYIISQGSSGTWQPLFPTAQVDDGSNRVDGWRAYTLPPDSNIVFDEHPGIEKLFIVFSRSPEPDLENLIYALRGRNPARPAAPVADPAAQTRSLMARASVDDATVGRLRNVYSRDLIVEAVTPSTPGEKKETAVYVVNPSGSDDSRVVADLALEHK